MDSDSEDGNQRSPSTYNRAIMGAQAVFIVALSRRGRNAPMPCHARMYPSQRYNTTQWTGAFMDAFFVVRGDSSCGKGDLFVNGPYLFGKQGKLALFIVIRGMAQVGMRWLHLEVGLVISGHICK